MQTANPPRKADLIEGFMVGLAAIHAFGDGTPRLTPTDLATRLQISRAAARRYLITLCHAGYASTDGRSYSLTPKVLTLGRAYMGSAQLPRTARPYLQQVTAATGESSNLTLLDGADVVYAASVNVARLMSTGIDAGTRLPAHTTAAGRVILTGKSREALDSWLAGVELTAYTPQTVVGKRAFAAEVAQARASGFSVVENQYEVGLRGIAVPLRTRDGEVLGALGVSMAAASCSLKEATRRCVPALQSAAAAMQDLI